MNIEWIQAGDAWPAPNQRCLAWCVSLIKSGQTEHDRTRWMGIVDVVFHPSEGWKRTEKAYPDQMTWVNYWSPYPDQPQNEEDN